MFKLVVLSVLIAIAAARPSYFDHDDSLLHYSAPATIIHEPSYAKVGHIVKSIPTAVSHQSSSIVHSSAHYVEPIIAPVLKTTYTAPILHSAPIYKSYAAPALHSYDAHDLSYSHGWAPSW